jgi:hypothetical protein
MTLPVLMGWLVGCATGTVDVFQTCELDLALSPAAAAPGTTVSASGGPYTNVRDTRVSIGGVRAEVTSVERVGCLTCDTCRLDADCAPCGPCFGIELTSEQQDACFGDGLADPPIPPACDACVETMAFVVPDGAPVGTTAVYVVNANGASGLVPFEVLAGASETSDTSVPADTSDTDTTP